MKRGVGDLNRSSGALALETSGVVLQAPSGAYNCVLAFHLGTLDEIVSATFELDRVSDVFVCRKLFRPMREGFLGFMLGKLYQN